MNRFVYYSPTKILFGKDMEREVGCEIAAHGGSRVLLVYGGGSARKSGLLDRVKSALASEGISFWCLGNIQPNPLLERVYDGIELIREKKIDFVLAVGGGSVIDTAKAAALGAEYKGDVWDFYEHLAEPKKTLPVGCILTLPASGSESSQASVITSQKNGGMKKRTESPDSQTEICDFKSRIDLYSSCLSDSLRSCRYHDAHAGKISVIWMGQ